MAQAPQELKKRPDGEWGTLPANAASRNDLNNNSLPASSGQQYQSNVQQNQPGVINSHQAANYGQPSSQPGSLVSKQPQKIHQIRKGSTTNQPVPILGQNGGSAGGPGNMPLFDDIESNKSL